MDSSGGRFNSPASISQHPTFQFSNSISDFVLNDIKNEELNWGSFNFKNEIESPNQNLYSSSFLFNSNIVSSSRTANYPVYDFKDQRGNVSDLNFQLQTWPTTISGNKMEESMKSQVLDWNDKSQPKEIDLSMEFRKVEPESLQFTQKDSNFNTTQASKQQDRFEDGYNWRKYGQKQVKGSKKPRSYFKCSYPNCPTKKKVEKDLNGYITEIIYKGKHNHPMPQNMKKSSLNSFQNTILDYSVDKNRLESSSQNSLASFGEDKYDQDSSNDYEDEPKAKKWKLDEAEDEAISYVGSKTLQEPRVVIETRSEVDILDDGYKWRKYGQKVIKGNPNPRSYYKCINIGCTVRKLVERASHDLQVVVTTYEAKHNHGVPAPRGRGGGSTYATNQPPTSNTTKNSNHHMPVTSMPLPNYLYNVHETTDKVHTPHSLQTLEYSKDYGFFESSYSNHDWEMLLLSTTKEGPKNEYFSNPFV